MLTGEIHVSLYVDFASDPKMLRLARYGSEARAARDLYVQMICYCKRLMSDGYVPDEAVGLLVYPDPPDVGGKDAERLAEVGLIERCEGGWQVSAFLKRNKSRAEIESDSGRKAEGAAIANHKRWHVKRQVTDPDCPHCRSSDRYSESLATPERSDHAIASDSSVSVSESSSCETNGSSREEPQPSQPQRDDVQRLCQHLADRIEGNGAKRPTVGKRWRDAARLMIDRDGRTEDQISRAIDWCQDDDFWHSNILSMPKLREQYDRLQLKAKAQKREPAQHKPSREHLPEAWR